MGLCPFHDDRTPSFTVYPNSGKFHCYGCGKHGDVISFLREKEGFNFNRRWMPWIDSHHNNHDSNNEDIKQQRSVPTVSAIFDDGSILETIYQPADKKTAFVIWRDGEWKFESGVSVDSFQRLVPYSPNNNLIKNEVVLLPSEPEEYGSEEALLREIQSFIHRYVDVSPLFEKIASYKYVLFSWVYDGFNELPYLRVRGRPRKREDALSPNDRLSLL